MAANSPKEHSLKVARAECLCAPTGISDFWGLDLGSSGADQRILEGRGPEEFFFKKCGGGGGGGGGVDTPWICSCLMSISIFRTGVLLPLHVLFYLLNPSSDLKNHFDLIKMGKGSWSALYPSIVVTPAWELPDNIVKGGTNLHQHHSSLPFCFFQKLCSGKRLSKMKKSIILWLLVRESIVRHSGRLDPWLGSLRSEPHCLLPPRLVLPPWHELQIWRYICPKYFNIISNCVTLDPKIKETTQTTNQIKCEWALTHPLSVI